MSLELDIIPILGLQLAFEVEGFMSSDLRSITVDQFVFERRPARYRFTLAHEIAHLCLHREILEKLKFSTVEEWKKFQLDVDAEDYSWLEYQAYSFAGLVLVPPDHLRAEFEACEGMARAEGVTLGSDAAYWYIAEALSGTFQVSSGVIEKRLRKDGLIREDR